jgi:hypothetical protein
VLRNTQRAVLPTLFNAIAFHYDSHAGKQSCRLCVRKGFAFVKTSGDFGFRIRVCARVSLRAGFEIRFVSSEVPARRIPKPCRINDVQLDTEAKKLLSSSSQTGVGVNSSPDISYSTHMTRGVLPSLIERSPAADDPGLSYPAQQRDTLLFGDLSNNFASNSVSSAVMLT